MIIQNILACYLRISDEDLDLKQNLLKDESSSISAQRKLIHDYIQSHEDLCRLEIHEFLDDGYSGTNFDRPSIQQIFQLIAQGQIACIIVKDMSRFGRNYIETGSYIEQIFPKLGVRFIAVNDSYDSMEYFGSTPGIDMTFKNLLYDYYSKDLSIKVKSIKKIQQQQGDFVAAKPPYGYIISPSNRHLLEIDPEAANTVKLIFEQTLAGQKPSKIARQLNDLKIPTPAQRLHALYGFHFGGMSLDELKAQFWKPYQITSILKNETLTGATVNNRVQVKGIGSRKCKRQKAEDHVIVRNTHEAIIDLKTFQKVAEIIQNRRVVNTKGRKKNENLFYQKIYCGHCGCRLKHDVHTHHGHVRASYYCPHARPAGGETCTVKSVKDELLRMYILKPLQAQALLILDRNINLPKTEKENLSERLRLILHQLDQSKEIMPRLYEEYKSGKISRQQFMHQKEDTAAKVQLLNSERDELEKELTQIDSLLKKSESESLLEITKLETLTGHAVDLFINKVIIHSTQSIEIIWKGNDLYEEFCSL